MKMLRNALLCTLLGLSTPILAAGPEAASDTPPATAESDSAPYEAQLSAEEMQYLLEAKKLWDSLAPRQGEIKLLDGKITLQIPENFSYLSPNDTETLLTQIWGNPPGTGKETLGMLIPAGVSPFDGASWGVTIEYEGDGNVSDEDADAIDYDDLLADMQESTREESKIRVSQGYESIDLIGWAAKPYYDQASHKLHWAKELSFGGDPNHTLNYDIRVLGREGVLVLSFIAGIEQQPMIEANLDQVLAMAEFNPGSRYEDFNPEIDKVAAYGIGALVAGKLAAKAGLFTAALLLLKKFGVFILIAFGALFGKIFKRKPPQPGA